DSNQDFIYTTYGTTTADIVVTVTATVTNASDSRTNTGWFTWTGKDTDTDSTDVEVYSYKITINKTDSSTSTALANAQFVLKNSQDKFYNLTNGVVTWVDAQGDATVFTTNGNGVAEITGLKNGTYTVMEIKAPDGYQLPTTGTEVTINNADGTAAITNTKGDTTPLPETGGLGTILFTVFGLIVVITTGVVLVTNKRMSKESI
ncbi:MAG: LPXTG cell wall anchor domain-containing protein, partial [Clostridia bacterium]|nr:LPXTG cell wall anchor domain-containing protein [Clostridia bacterium]